MQFNSVRKQSSIVVAIASLCLIPNLSAEKAEGALITFSGSGVINIDATKSGISMPNGVYTGSTLMNPVQEIFPAGTYTANITSTVLSPLSAAYSGWSFNANTPLAPTFLENFAAFADTGGAPITSSPVVSFSSSNIYLTLAQALVDGVAQGTFTFTVPTTETLDFVVPDNFLSDNSGGVSVSITAASVVPEPASFAIMAVAGMLLGRRSLRRAV